MIVVLFGLLAAAGCGKKEHAGDTWISNPALASRLGPEVVMDGFAIRPPAGFALQQIPMDGPDASGMMYVWTGALRPDQTSPRFTVTRVHDTSRAPIPIVSAQEAAIAQTDMSSNHNQVVKSNIETGQANGLPMARGYWRGLGPRTGVPYHGIVYSTVSPWDYVTVVAKDREPSSKNWLPVFEAAAQTMRKL